MEIVFKKKDLYELYIKGISKKYTQNIIQGYQDKISFLRSMKNINEIKNYKGLNFEKLKNYIKGEYSIRINNQYRILFNILENGALHIIEITELSKHYE